MSGLVVEYSRFGIGDKKSFFCFVFGTVIVVGKMLEIATVSERDEVKPNMSFTWQVCCDGVPGESQATSPPVRGTSEGFVPGPCGLLLKAMPRSPCSFPQAQRVPTLQLGYHGL